MGTAQFHGQQLEDDQVDAFGNPINNGSGFGNATPPPANGSYATADEMIAAMQASPQWKDVPPFMREKLIAEARIKFERVEQEGRAKAIEDRIPGLIEDSRVDPNADLKFYTNGDPLDLSRSVNDLYDPTKGPQHSASQGLDFTESDKTGRGAQVNSLDYFGGVMKSGHDDASDAYYEAKRADAEQSARAQRDAAQQNLDEQGRGSGGASLLNELMSARDVSSQGHNAALGAAAMAQGRKDHAADSNARVGYGLQSQDNAWANDKTQFGMDKADDEDAFQFWYGDKLTGFGKDKSMLHQNEDVTNYGRDKQVRDANVPIYNGAVYHNAGLPAQEWSMLGDANGISTGASEHTVQGTQDKLERDAAGSPAAFIGGGIQTLGNIVDLYKNFAPDDEDKEPD